MQHTGSLMERWHTGEVAVFLDKCGLAHLQATFDKHRYSLDCLHGLDKEQLMGLGLTTLGERHKFRMVSLPPRALCCLMLPSAACLSVVVTQLVDYQALRAPEYAALLPTAVLSAECSSSLPEFAVAWLMADAEPSSTFNTMSAQLEHCRKQLTTPTAGPASDTRQLLALCHGDTKRYVSPKSVAQRLDALAARALRRTSMLAGSVPVVRSVHSWQPLVRAAATLRPFSQVPRVVAVPCVVAVPRVVAVLCN